jgi:hypothetical protein
LERGETLSRLHRRSSGRPSTGRRRPAEEHFIGWLGDVDPDELFASGKAWGLSLLVRDPDGLEP